MNKNAEIFSNNMGCNDSDRQNINNYDTFNQYYIHADHVGFCHGANNKSIDKGLSLMVYISDPQRRKEIVESLAIVKDLKTLCRSILWDIYNTDLNNLKDKDKIIVGEPFITLFIPLLKSCGGALTVRNIRVAIHLYVLGDTANKGEKMK